VGQTLDKLPTQRPEELDTVHLVVEVLLALAERGGDVDQLGDEVEDGLDPALVLEVDQADRAALLLE
jgi:hypothetical protein